MAQMSLPVATFLEEAQEVLETLEARLLELEGASGDMELVGAVFRNLHTLKGSGEMFGFSALAAFTHSFETVFDAVRNGTLAITPALIDVSLRSRDHIQKLIDAGTDAETNATLKKSPEGLALLAELEALAGGEAPAAEARAGAGMATEETGSRSRLWRIAFRPGADALKTGSRPDLLIEELAALGEAEVSVDASAVPPLGEIDPMACYLAWEVRLRTAAPRSAIDDIFIFADEGELTVEEIPEEIAEGATEGATGETRTASPLAEPGETPPQPPQPSQPSQASQPRAGSDSIRVQAERLDAFMDTLGELVIAQARLNRISTELGDAQLIATAEEVERLITSLRDATLSIRMLPIGGVFGKFRRLVRDLSSELGKSVSLVTEGGETELDKNVIDRLSEPLVHIIRNSVDHGIETAEARAAAGKPGEATVRMTAQQAGGEVLITVSDDGRGLDLEAIRARAIERGVIGPDDTPTDAEIRQLIFAPGFSTAKTLSSVSGRGVGMDAVRSVITDLGGEVEVRSEWGRGTAVTLRLPLTLAIIEGLLVRVAGDSYVLPLSSVDECVNADGAALRRESGRSILTLREELVPFIALESLFGFSETAEMAGRKIVIVRTETRRVGLVVDDIVGQHQTVIKSLSPYHRDLAGLAGGTILGDGSVALILDPPALVRSVRGLRQEAA